MINFFRIAGVLFSQGPWGAWSSERRSKSNKKSKKNKAREDSDSNNEPKNNDGNNDSGSNNENNNDDNDKKPEEEVKEEAKEETEPKEEEKSESQEKNNTIVGPWGNSKPKTDSRNNNISEQKKYEGLIKDLVEGHSINRKKGGSNNSGGNGGDFFDKFSKSPKKAFMTILLVAVSLWLATGFYKVDSDENALVLYFGKYHTIATPGLNYRIPYPVGRVVKQSVTTVNSEEFGYTSRGPAVRRFNRRSANTNETDHSENLMLTGDENIVDIEFQVQWQIKDIEKFTFNIAEPRLTIRKAAESAMREIIAVTPISEALSDGKSRIEQDAKALLQKTLDDYGAGVRIVLLQLRRVDPPPQVIDAFRDVQTAKADKEKEINEAQAYANDIIPRARGNAAQMQEQAMAYKSRVTNDAQGEANRFLALHAQYKGAKEVTRKRIYLETMQKVYGDIDKVIIDNKLSKGSLMPYFPLGDLNRTNTVKK